MLDAQELTVRFGTTRILNNLSVQIRAGEAVGMIGPNGSGKTTLFNALSGFIPLSKGSIKFNQLAIEDLEANERANLGIARVFQNSGIFKELTVGDNMVVALESRADGFNPIFKWGKKYKALLQQAREILSEVGLANKLNDKAASLSGGQLRLLEISRAVAFGAELFLLDEPTAGVSPKMKDEVIHAVRKLSERGKTILTIEHDINLIDRFCERVVVLDAGQIVLQGTPMEVRNDPMLQEVYFGVNNK